MCVAFRRTEWGVGRGCDHATFGEHSPSSSDVSSPMRNSCSMKTATVVIQVRCALFCTNVDRERRGVHLQGCCIRCQGKTWGGGVHLHECVTSLGEHGIVASVTWLPVFILLSRAKSANTKVVSRQIDGRSLKCRLIPLLPAIVCNERKCDFMNSVTMRRHSTEQCKIV